MVSKTKRRKGKAKAAVGKGVSAHAVREALRRQLPSEALRLADELVAKKPSTEHRALFADVIVARLGAMMSGRVDTELASQLVDRLEELAADPAAADRAAAWKTAAKQFRILLLGEGSLQDDSQLLARLVDLAVRNADFLGRLPAEVAEETRAVAASLGEVERGNDAAALEGVAGIGFRSPLAPWRLFIRGLVHYYGGDFDQANAAWDRLPADRPPRRIARILMALQERSVGDDPRPGEAALRPLRFVARQADDDSAVELRRAWTEEDPLVMTREAGRLIRSTDGDARWTQAISERIWSRMVVIGTRRDLARMERDMPPPRWDPELVLAEVLQILLSPDEHDESELTKSLNQLGDQFAELDRNPRLDASERGPLRATIALHLAQYYHGFHQAIVRFRAGSRSRPPAREVWQKLTRETMLRLLQWASENSPGWDRPVALAQEMMTTLDEPDEALLGDIFARYADVHPENPQALRQLYTAMDELGRYEEAEAAILKLEELAPRDPLVRAARCRRHLERIRALAVEGQFEAATRLLEELQQDVPPGVPPFDLPLLAAAVEYRRGDTESGQRHLDTAREAGAGEATLAALMEIHAIRMQLPLEVRWRFRDLREQEMKGKDPRQAAQLARVLGPILKRGQPYSAAATHRRALLRYIRRCLSVKLAEWTPQDVRDVTIACIELDDSIELEQKIFKKFRRSMGNEPIIHFLAGFIDADPYPGVCFRRAIEESQRRPEVALPSGLLKFAAEEQERISMGLGILDDEVDEDEEEDLDIPDGIEEAMEEALFQQLGGPDEIERHMQIAGETLRKAESRIHSPEDLVREIRKALAPVPPLLRKIMIGQLIRQAGPEVGRFLEAELT